MECLWDKQLQMEWMLVLIEQVLPIVLGLVRTRITGMQ